MNCSNPGKQTTLVRSFCVQEGPRGRKNKELINHRSRREQRDGIILFFAIWPISNSIKQNDNFISLSAAPVVELFFFRRPLRVHKMIEPGFVRNKTRTINLQLFPREFTNGASYYQAKSSIHRGHVAGMEYRIPPACKPKAGGRQQYLLWSRRFSEAEAIGRSGVAF